MPEFDPELAPVDMPFPMEIRLDIVDPGITMEKPDVEEDLWPIIKRAAFNRWHEEVDVFEPWGYKGQLPPITEIRTEIYEINDNIQKTRPVRNPFREYKLDDIRLAENFDRKDYYADRHRETLPLPRFGNMINEMYEQKIEPEYEVMNRKYRHFERAAQLGRIAIEAEPGMGKADFFGNAQRMREFLDGLAHGTTPEPEKSLAEQIVHVPKGWNRRRLERLIKGRLDAGIDATVYDATRWLDRFEAPETLDGERLYSADDELSLIMAAAFGHNTDKLPTRSSRIAKLFHAYEGGPALYQEVLVASKAGDHDTVKGLLTGAPFATDKLFNLYHMAQSHGMSVSDRQQATILARLHDMSKRRQGYVTDAQNWLSTHSDAPQQLLIESWQNRRMAVMGGSADNPRAIVAWVKEHELDMTLSAMAQNQTAPENVTADDFKTYAPLMAELTRCYSKEMAIKALGRHKEIFNPDALMPAYSRELENGWRLEVLAKDDPRGYTIGPDTGCCMKVGWEAESCIIAGYSDERYGFMAIYDADNRLMAQSLLYINPDVDQNTIVIDNIEQTHGISRTAALKKYQEALPEYVDLIMQQTGRSIDRILLGVHVIESYDGTYKVSAPVPTPDPTVRTDAHTQMVVFDALIEQASVHFEPMTLSDIQTVTAMEETIHGPVDEMYAEDQIDTTRSSDTYSYFIRDPETQQNKGYLIAHVEPSNKGPHEKEGQTLYVDDLAILPSEQRSGLGREALRFLLGTADRLKLPLVFHAKNNTSWQILKTHQAELRDMGYDFAQVKSIPHYYDNNAGAHLVELVKI